MPETPEAIESAAAATAAPARPRPTLVDRGDGLLYDPALGITWLKEANFARTSKPPGTTPRGGMRLDGCHGLGRRPRDTG
ncbi:MAG: hypothetical protein ACK5WE_05495, partial [bacterium]